MLLHLPGRLQSHLNVRLTKHRLQKGNARLCAASAGRHPHRCLSITAQRLETLTLKAEDLTPDAFTPFGQVHKTCLKVVILPSLYVYLRAMHVYIRFIW